MSQSFLSRIRQSLGLAAGVGSAAGAARVHLGIFGKHPGWDDHIPGLGLSEEPLLRFKRSLYDGITGNVDNGEWDKLSKLSQLEKFGHTLLAPTSDGWMAARCWQSSDGKGRDRYPMVAAALCRDLPLSWVAREAIPALAALQEMCAAAHTAASVEQLMRESEHALRKCVPLEGVAPDPPSTSSVLSYLADRAELGPDHLGLLRLIYHFEREMEPSRGKKFSATRSNQFHSFSLRVPPCADSPTAAAQLWLRFHSAYPEKSWALACVPDHNKWLDFIVGPPIPSLLYSMRAPLEVIPFTTDIPYTLDAQFVRRINRFLAAQRMADLSSASNLPAWPLAGSA